MSYRRDNEFSAGHGAIAAIDGASSIRRRIRAAQAKNTALREQRVARVRQAMGATPGNIPVRTVPVFPHGGGGGGPHQLVPPTFPKAGGPFGRFPHLPPSPPPPTTPLGPPPQVAPPPPVTGGDGAPGPSPSSGGFVTGGSSGGGGGGGGVMPLPTGPEVDPSQVALMQPPQDPGDLPPEIATPSSSSAPFLSTTTGKVVAVGVGAVALWAILRNR